MTQKDYISGEIILVDKPYGWTSFDAVNKIRSVLKHKLQLDYLKVGHAGTLDPLATGLLILCTGGYTKKIREFQELDKEYTGTFTLGATTPSYDLETEIIPAGDYKKVTEKMLHEAARKFTGEMMQVPPLFSARNIGGERAYRYARAGKEIQMEARKVEIRQFEITAVKLPEVQFRIVCSKGTYIRSVARDFGEFLSCGAYLSELRRTKIGNFDVGNAITPDEFEKTLS